ncbi:MAG: hypothetical protein JST93_18050 [Acidobacteria bacterium]|nr:hypothetical protein [Acidobacteriota bacterium]
MERHCTPEQLLAWLDGELADAALEAHITRCEECRRQAEEWGTASDAYRNHLDRSKQEAPPPPRAWKDTTELMVQAPAPARGRAWMAIAASVLIGALAIWRFATPEQVSAAELLRKAESSVSVQNAGSRISVRSKRDKMVRPAVWRRVRVRGASEDRLRGLFASANYDWDAPLSARSYNAWRQSVKVRRDSVDVQPQMYVVHTEPEGSALREATISLRKSDLHPIACHLQFRDNEEIEVSEAAADGEAETPATPNSNRIASEPQQPSLPIAAPSIELQVAEVLHRIGADLGDPVDIESTGGTIVVTATGLDPRKSEQLRAALTIPGVELRFVTPQQASSAEQTQEAAPPVRRAVRDWEQRLSGRFTYEEFADRVLAATEGMTARAYALKALAERFPVSKEEQLSATERASLEGIAADHVAAMRTQVQRLDQLIAILAPTAESVAAGAASGDWHARAQRLHTLSTAADLAASALFSPDANANPQAIRAAVLRVAAALEEWR